MLHLTGAQVSPYLCRNVAQLLRKMAKMKPSVLSRAAPLGQRLRKCFFSCCFIARDPSWTSPRKQRNEIGLWHGVALKHVQPFLLLTECLSLCMQINCPTQLPCVHLQYDWLQHHDHGDGWDVSRAWVPADRGWLRMAGWAGSGSVLLSYKTLIVYSQMSSKCSM